MLRRTPILAPGGSLTMPGMSSISDAETDFGARTMLLSIRTLAKNLRTIPGRKILVLFSSGFPLTGERTSELTATIDACNKSNVAVYSLDVRGLQTGLPDASSSQLHRKSRLAPVRWHPRAARS